MLNKGRKTVDIKNIKTWVRNIDYERRFYPFLGPIFVFISIFGIGIFLFLNLISNLDKALNKPVTQLPPQGMGIDFKAIDKIALKLGIEIPARNIPSQTELARNEPPKIFNFTSIRSQVLAGDKITLFLNTIDPEGDEIEVDWTSTGGKLSLLSPFGPARWEAPEEIGTYSIKVAVRDKKPDHQDVTASLDIKVIPRPVGEIPAQEIPEFATRLVGLVKEEGEENIYLVKSEAGKLYKRLLVDIKIVDFYGHLSLNNIQTVPQGMLDDYQMTNLIRGKDRYKVYQINNDGTKHWLNMPWETFIAGGGSNETIFTVNDEEINFYPSGPDIAP